MAKSKFYTVRNGHNPGVYTSWAECEAQVKGFPGAEFKSFGTQAAAEEALRNGWSDSPAPVATAPKAPPAAAQGDFIKDSLSVDAACAGNPGVMEYQCVNTGDGSPVFASQQYPVGTNNIGEFLAVVDALKHLQAIGSDMPIYTDSVTAIAWVRNRRLKTTLVRTDVTASLFDAIDAALDWLNNNSYTNPVLKWQTESWGESKADFGRK